MIIGFDFMSVFHTK